MNQGIEGRHEEVLSRHPLAALSFGAQRNPVIEQAPTVADRRGIF